MQEFPDFSVEKVNLELLKSEAAKAKWRPWMNKYEKRVQDFNFGTLLRLDASEDYTEENSIFGKLVLLSTRRDLSYLVATRIQFLAIEITRNRLQLNDIHCVKK